MRGQRGEREGGREGIGGARWRVRVVQQTGQCMLTKGQNISAVHLPGVEGFAIGIDQLLHLQVLSLNRHPWRLQSQSTS